MVYSLFWYVLLKMQLHNALMLHLSFTGLNLSDDRLDYVNINSTPLLHWTWDWWSFPLSWINAAELCWIRSLSSMNSDSKISLLCLPCMSKMNVVKSHNLILILGCGIIDRDGSPFFLLQEMDWLYVFWKIFKVIQVGIRLYATEVVVY